MRLDWLARIFAKFCADVFLLESQATGKSEKDDINTGDLWWAWICAVAERLARSTVLHWEKLAAASAVPDPPLLA